MYEGLIDNKENEPTIIEIHDNQVGQAIPVQDIISEANNEPTCRFCRNGVQIEGQNPTPLISACLCNGYGHKKCIINYLNENQTITSCQSCNYEYKITYDYFDKNAKMNFWDLFTFYMILEILALAFVSSFLLLIICSATDFDNAGIKFLFCTCIGIGIFNLVWIIQLFLFYGLVKLYYKKLFGYKNKFYFGLYIFFGFFCQMAYESISKDHTKVVNICEREIQQV